MNRHDRQTHWYAVAASLLVIGLAAGVTACGKASVPMNRHILGKWANADGELYEFFKDGTVSMSSWPEGQTMAARYSFPDEDHMRIDIQLMGSVVWSIDRNEEGGLDVTVDGTTHNWKRVDEGQPQFSCDSVIAVKAAEGQYRSGAGARINVANTGDGTLCLKMEADIQDRPQHLIGIGRSVKGWDVRYHPSAFPVLSSGESHEAVVSLDLLPEKFPEGTYHGQLTAVWGSPGKAVEHKSAIPMEIVVERPDPTPLVEGTATEGSLTYSEFRLFRLSCRAESAYLVRLSANANRPGLGRDLEITWSPPLEVVTTGMLSLVRNASDVDRDVLLKVQPAPGGYRLRADALEPRSFDGYESGERVTIQPNHWYGHAFEASIGESYVVLVKRESLLTDRNNLACLAGAGDVLTRLRGDYRTHIRALTRLFALGSIRSGDNYNQDGCAVWNVEEAGPQWIVLNNTERYADARVRLWLYALPDGPGMDSE